MSLDPLKPYSEVLQPDERWRYFSLTLQDHHQQVAAIQVNAAAPENVRQQFENARNAWLYAFFAYRLLTVALATVHVVCETAVKARAEQEGLPGWEKKRLSELLEIAISKRWLVDSGFAAAGQRIAQCYWRLARRTSVLISSRQTTRPTPRLWSGWFGSCATGWRMAKRS